jgi:DDE family transposase
MGEFSGWSADLVVSDGGRNLVSRAGTAALRMLADQVGLTSNLSEALARPDTTPVHDRGRVIVDVGVSIADGAETISEIETMGESPELYGHIASVPTVWRCLGETAEAGPGTITAAAAATRVHAWDLIAARHGGLPAIRVADRQIRDMVGIRIDASLVGAHTDKQGAAPNFKKGFGFHPLYATCDNTREPLASKLRPGNAGSNTTTDHIEVLDAAIAAIPPAYRNRLWISVDGAGASHGLINHLQALAQRPEHEQVWWTCGWALGERERRAISRVPEHAWQTAIDTDGDPRTSRTTRDAHGQPIDAAQLVDLTDLLKADGELDGWPDGMRLIARRERPHPGAQLSLFEEREGWRYHLFVTNVPRLPAGHNNALLNNLAYLDAAERAHARVEDRIKDAKDCGMGKLPSHDFDRNQAWLETAALAQTLLSWFALLSLDGDLAKAEPKTLRYKILHVAAKLVRGQRKRHLQLDQTWPWAKQLVTAFKRIQALPAGP